MDPGVEEPNELALMLDDALASLRAKDRTAIIARYLRGHDLESVAVSLGTSSGAVQKRIERSLNKLRDYCARRQRDIDSTSIAAIGSAAAAPPFSIAATVKAAVIRPGVASAASITLAKGVLFMRTLKITATSLASLSLGVAIFVCVEKTAVSNAAAPTTKPNATPGTNPSAIESPAAVDGPFAKLAPFSDIKWDGESAQILVDGKWYNWVSIDGRSLATLVKDARGLDNQLWQKRIDEDLVELLARTGHPAGSVVKLVVNPIDDAGKIQTLDKVPMTEENRRSVHEHRLERGEK